MVIFYKLRNPEPNPKETLMEIRAEDKNWKCWVEDNGWQVSFSYSIPRLTKSGHIGCKWQKANERIEKSKDVAMEDYAVKCAYLEDMYCKKEIAQYHISLMHLTRLKTRCPVCGGDADILTFMLCMGGDDKPSTSINCEHCCAPGQNPIENQVGVYYFKEPCFEDDPEEKSFAQHKYIITVEDLKKD